MSDELDGVLVVDKPAGPSSHDVVARVRRAARMRRVGHTGTLDPAATGVLVLCLGRATRLVSFLQAGTKVYAARLVLGVETDSQDAQGEVVARTSAAHVDEAALAEALVGFVGEIDQIPPMVSAVKVGGERLYAKARRGEVLEREPRRVHVHELVLEGFTPGEHPEASVRVTCSAGTYVRTLAHDVGQRLGVGASLVALRRVANGPFTLDEAHDLDAIDAAADRAALAELVVEPRDAVARALPVAELDDPSMVLTLARGGRIAADRLGEAHDGPFALCAGPRLIGVYQCDEGVESNERVARPLLVWTRPEELA